MKPLNNEYYKEKHWCFRREPSFSFYIHLQSPQGNTSLHGHEFTEIAVIISGEGVHISEKHAPVPIRRKMILIIPPGGKHAYRETKDLQVINVLFDGNDLPAAMCGVYTTDAYRKFFNRKYTAYGEEDYPLLEMEENSFSQLENILRNAIEKPVTAQWHSYKLGVLMILMSEICNSSSEDPSGDQSPFNVTELLHYMQENLHRKLSLDDLALQAAMSRETLSRHFKKTTGVSPMTYLIQLRLKHAAELLVNSRLPLKHTAELSGFPETAHFARSFKKYFGISPGQYRVQKEKNIVPQK